MSQQPNLSAIKNAGNCPPTGRVVIPIDLDWRKKYYRKVFWKRALAFLLDYFTTFIIASIPAVMLFPGKSEESLDYCAIFQLFFFILLCAFMESSKWQATFGMRIMKIQITNYDGNSISFFRSLLRNLLRIITGYSYFFIIPLIIQIFRFRKTRKLFHDELSRTIIGERLSMG